MEFLVKSKSSGSEYTVKVFQDGENPVITCSCPAGDSGQYCKHRFALIDGDDSEVVQSSHTAADLVAIVQGTHLEAAIAQMRDQEKAIKAGQAELKRIKKRVAQIMRGQIT